MIARLELMLGALLFSTGGVAIKLSAFDGWQVAGLRAVAAAGILLLLLPAARRGWSWRSGVVAVPYAATFVLFTLANKQTTAAAAIFLQDTAPLYLLLLAPLLLREAIGRLDVALLLALAFGAWLIFAAAAEPLATAPQPGAGNVLALVSGATWALSLLGLRWIARRGIESGEEPLTVIVAGCLIAAVASAPSAFPLPESTAVDWAIVLYLGAFQIGLAYLFVTRGMRHVSALEASLLLLIEPVLSPLWAWLLLDETPSALALVGGAVIIAATAINTALRGKARRASRAAVG